MQTIRKRRIPNKPSNKIHNFLMIKWVWTKLSNDKRHHLWGNTNVCFLFSVWCLVFCVRLIEPTRGHLDPTIGFLKYSGFELLLNGIADQFRSPSARQVIAAYHCFMTNKITYYYWSKTWGVENRAINPIKFSILLCVSILYR